MNNSPYGEQFCRMHAQPVAPVEAPITTTVIRADIYPSRKRPVYIGRRFPTRMDAILFLKAAGNRLDRVCRPGEELRSFTMETLP